MVTLIGQKCCYFMKSSGSLYLPDDDFRTCFLEEFHYYDIKSGKHQIRQTQPFPNLDDDLDNYGVNFWCWLQSYVNFILFRLTHDTCGTHAVFTFFFKTIHGAKCLGILCTNCWFLTLTLWRGQKWIFRLMICQQEQSLFIWTRRPFWLSACKTNSQIIILFTGVR